MFITSSWCSLFSGSEVSNKLMNKLNSEVSQVRLSFTRHRTWSKKIFNNKSIINNLKNPFSIESVWPSVSFSAFVYARHFIVEVNGTHVFVIIQNTWWSSKNQIIPFLIMSNYKCLRILSDMNVTKKINWFSIHPNCRYHSIVVILSSLAISAL